ncbi:MAG: flagellar hook-associated family protein [Rhizobiaceae bacterium]|nr:flagellar hook-associated family protein [Hyphomicrobiales bacterium]NRB30519.1 flagellar hook-associated family protein [Rhizobiaceae bacterium]
MKISQVSTQAMFDNLRYSMSNLQRDFTDAQKEVATGQVSDAGLSIGANNGRRFNMMNDINRLQVISDTNNRTQGRLEMSITATGSINETAQSLFSTLTASVGGTSTAHLTQAAGESAIKAITGLMNTSLNGEYIFGGINSDEAPINEYENGGPKAAIDAAFLGHFGFAATDAAAVSISGAAMTNFIDTVLNPLITGANWTSTFSNAADETITARIGLNESISGSVSGNEQGFQNVMLAAVVAAEFINENFNAEAQSAAAKAAIDKVGISTGQLAELQGLTGLLVNRTSEANERIAIQMDELTLHSDKMVAVDPYEAATRLNSLITQIETSYTLTGRIQQLSLMRYI